jgi:hypothetical protein
MPNVKHSYLILYGIWKPHIVYYSISGAINDYQ